MLRIIFYTNIILFTVNALYATNADRISRTYQGPEASDVIDGDGNPIAGLGPNSYLQREWQRDDKIKEQRAEIERLTNALTQSERQRSAEQAERQRLRALYADEISAHQRTQNSLDLLNTRRSQEQEAFQRDMASLRAMLMEEQRQKNAQQTKIRELEALLESVNFTRLRDTQAAQAISGPVTAASVSPQQPRPTFYDSAVLARQRTTLAELKEELEGLEKHIEKLVKNRTSLSIEYDRVNTEIPALIESFDQYNGLLTEKQKLFDFSVESFNRYTQERYKRHQEALIQAEIDKEQDLKNRQIQAIVQLLKSVNKSIQEETLKQLEMEANFTHGELQQIRSQIEVIPLTAKTVSDSESGAASTPLRKKKKRV